jgi:hypothetical protein
MVRLLAHPFPPPHTGRLRKKDKLLKGKGGWFGRGAKGYLKTACPSINHSILSDSNTPTFRSSFKISPLLIFLQSKIINKVNNVIVNV